MVDAILAAEDDKVLTLLDQGASPTICNLNCQEHGFKSDLVSVQQLSVIYIGVHAPLRCL